MGRRRPGGRRPKMTPEQRKKRAEKQARREERRSPEYIARKEAEAQRQREEAEAARRIEEERMAEIRAMAEAAGVDLSDDSGEYEGYDDESWEGEGLDDESGEAEAVAAATERFRDRVGRVLKRVGPGIGLLTFYAAILALSMGGPHWYTAYAAERTKAVKKAERDEFERTVDRQAIARELLKAHHEELSFDPNHSELDHWVASSIERELQKKAFPYANEWNVDVKEDHFEKGILYVTGPHGLVVQVEEKHHETGEEIVKIHHLGFEGGGIYVPPADQEDREVRMKGIRAHHKETLEEFSRTGQLWWSKEKKRVIERSLLTQCFPDAQSVELFGTHDDTEKGLRYYTSPEGLCVKIYPRGNDEEKSEPKIQLLGFQKGGVFSLQNGLVLDGEAKVQALMEHEKYKELMEVMLYSAYLSKDHSRKLYDLEEEMKSLFPPGIERVKIKRTEGGYGRRLVVSGSHGLILELNFSHNARESDKTVFLGFSDQKGVFSKQEAEYHQSLSSVLLSPLFYSSEIELLNERDLGAKEEEKRRRFITRMKKLMGHFLDLPEKVQMKVGYDSEHKVLVLRVGEGKKATVQAIQKRDRDFPLKATSISGQAAQVTIKPFEKPLKTITVSLW